MRPNPAEIPLDSIDCPLKSYIHCAQKRAGHNCDGTAPGGRTDEEGESIGEVAPRASRRVTANGCLHRWTRQLWDLPSGHPTGVSENFPNATPLVSLGIDCYMGVPFLDSEGEVLGHLAVFDERPMPPEPRRLFIFRIFAARTTAELERLRAEKRLSESEGRYRDLYEEAPVGYLSVSGEGRILSTNHRAAQMIGHTEDEVNGRCIFDFFADTSAARGPALNLLSRFLAGSASKA